MKTYNKQLFTGIALGLAIWAIALGGVLAWLAEADGDTTSVDLMEIPSECQPYLLAQLDTFQAWDAEKLRRMHSLEADIAALNYQIDLLMRELGDVAGQRNMWERKAAEKDSVIYLFITKVVADADSTTN